MAIKMVIFDKDGTLMDFDSFWVTVSRLAVADMLEELHADAGLLDKLLSAMGVQDGTTDVQGVLCWGTYRQMGEVLYRTLQENGVACDEEEVVKLTSRTYHAHADEGIIQPACGEHVKVCVFVGHKLCHRRVHIVLCGLVILGCKLAVVGNPYVLTCIVREGTDS